MQIKQIKSDYEVIDFSDISEKYDPESRSICNYPLFNFIKNEPFGIELDLDAIPNIPSSAMTLSGFSVDKARHFVYYFGKHQNASYFHICEGAPTLDDSKNNHLTGKLIASLITDFMKAKIG